MQVATALCGSRIGCDNGPIVLGGLSDLRFALRQFRNHFGFSIAAVAVLALGIGSTDAVFSVLYEALLKPLPYPDPDRLVTIHNWFPKSQQGLTDVSALDFEDLGRHVELWSGTAAYFFNDMTMTGQGNARHVDVVDASASLFTVLEAKSQLGRLIQIQDDSFRSPKVALVSDGLWRNDFAADTAVVGRSIQLDGQPYTIVGVMPPSFQFPYAATQLWIPLVLSADDLKEEKRGSKGLRMLARLRAGSNVERTNAELAAIGHGLAHAHPYFYPESEGWRFRASLLSDEGSRPVRSWIYLAFGLVLCVFIIACSNASGLLVVRSLARRNELALRRSLGATRGRILRQLLIETGFLVLTGGALGVGMAQWAIALANHYGPATLHAKTGLAMLLFAVSASGLATVGSAILPVLVSWRLPLDQTIKGSSSRTQTHAAPGWQAMVTAQIALAVVLVFAAVLLNASMLKLMNVPPGFAPHHVWSGAIDLPPKDYGRARRSPAQFFEELRQRIAAIPGVESASGAVGLPFNPSGFWTADLFFPSRPETNLRSAAEFNVVLPGYFEALGIVLRRGRTFQAFDGQATAPVAVINQEFARRYFAHEDPVGKIVMNDAVRNFPSRVIGVVENTQHHELGGPAAPEVYWLESQFPVTSMYVLARQKTNEDITPAVRSRIAQLDPAVALYDVATMDQRIAASLRLRRFIAVVLTAFGALGLVLAAIGLSGSLAHFFELRRKEIGIRVAVGASRHRILALVLRQAVFVVGAGTIAGLAAAQLGGYLLRSLLFGIRAYDARICAGVVGLLVLATLAAAAIPGLRAVRLHPMDTLRE